MRPVLLCIVLVCGSVIPAAAQQLKEITNSIGMKLVLIHAGSFTMGSPESEIGRQEDETPHEVTISNSYYLGAFEVTQGQYEKVIGENPSQFKEVKNPVENVNWDKAVSYCRRLSEMPEEKAAKRVYRLPTEAEWEYACRATSSAAYSFGDLDVELGEYGWFIENSIRKTHPVGSKKSNRWGLYDMHGNVYEWCQDWYDPSAGADTSGPSQGSYHVVRGGCWTDDAIRCRSALRDGFDGWDSHFFGFRVAMSLPAKQPESASAK